MDESLQELENELKTLQPRRAPARWLDQVNRELVAELPATPLPRYTTASNWRSWQWLGWRTAGLAAALALAAAIGVIRFRVTPPVSTDRAVATITPPAPLPAAASYQPVTATNVLYDLKDEGVVKVDGDNSARQVRARYVDTYTWKNPRNNSSIKWTVPRDEVRVVPASYNPN